MLGSKSKLTHSLTFSISGSSLEINTVIHHLAMLQTVGHGGAEGLLAMSSLPHSTLITDIQKNVGFQTVQSFYLFFLRDSEAKRKIKDK